MNYVYLLDTNIVSELVKNPTGIIYEKIKDVGEDKICISIRGKHRVCATKCNLQNNHCYMTLSRF